MNTVTEPNHFTADDERMLLDAIDNWVEKSVRPIARKYDHADKYPTELDCGTDLQAIRTVAKKRRSLCQQGQQNLDHEFRQWWRNLFEAAQEAHLHAHDTIHRDAEGAMHLNNPIRFREEPAAPDWPVPEIGQHNNEIFKRAVPVVTRDALEGEK